ncbi:MAG: ankyrin repeat domain-containing protein [Alphaproteobacteria bacterium]|nr:MAG: ankyrin repeat domain-containing protein [Alphaproteobacteria bacterium]
MHPFAADFPSTTDLAREAGRAAQLLKEVRAGAPVAAARFRHSHARFAWMADEVIRKVARVSDARFVAAREYGFGSWARLRDYLNAPGGKREVRQPFETELQYYRDRAAGMLSVFGTGERNALRLVREFHPDYSSASEADIRAARLTQADAELILAREHGFATFDAFARYIEALREGRVTEPFALAFAAIKEDDRARLNELLEHNPRLVNAAGTNGNRLLTFAVSFRRTGMMEDLLAAGADPDLPNNKGWTALHQAAYAGSDDMSAGALERLALLLRAGASPYAEAYGDGGTPLAVALFWGHRLLAGPLSRPVAAPSSLRVAAGLGRLDLMEQFFVGNKLRPEARWHREFHRPHSGFPPWRPSDDAAEILNEALTYAARSGRIEAMAFLAERGADLDA